MFLIFFEKKKKKKKILKYILKYIQNIKIYYVITVNVVIIILMNS